MNCWWSSVELCDAAGESHNEIARNYDAEVAASKTRTQAERERLDREYARLTQEGLRLEVWSKSLELFAENIGNRPSADVWLDVSPQSIVSHAREAMAA